jgi:site-specific recombinase XerD
VQLAVDMQPVGTPTDQTEATLQSWVQHFLDDLVVVRSANTRAYAGDLGRWIAFCRNLHLDPLKAHPRTAISFVRAERERNHRSAIGVSPRTIVRRLSAVRQWYAYLALEPELTGVHRNPIPSGNAIRTGAGVIAGRPALLKYDQPLPQVLSVDEIDCFLAQLRSTRFRDSAIVWLLKDGGMRIGEVLQLRLDHINWGKRILMVRATKSRRERLVPLTHEAITALSNYVRHERPKQLAHDVVFVNLGRRGFGKPFRYRSWVAVCDQARMAAGTPRVHAHAFRHTFATNMAESGMPLDALQRLLGHRNMDTVMIYNQVRDGRVYREYQEAMAVQDAAWRLPRPRVDRS